MKRKLLNRISHFFTLLSSSETSPTSKETTIDEWTQTLKQNRPQLSRRKGWATFAVGKKTRKEYTDIPVDEWFASPLEKQVCGTSLSSTIHVGCFFDEKVEISVPSAPTASFITTTSGYPEISYCFSSTSLSLEQQDQEQSHAPRTSFDEQEPPKKNRVPIDETIELAIVVNQILGDAFTFTDNEIFGRDDFYDPA